MWQFYLRSLETRPLLSKVLTAGVLLGIGDAVAQLAIEKTDDYDVVRTARMSSFGLMIAGPAMHGWYGFLQSRIVGEGLVPGIKRMVVDQTVFAPFMITSFFVQQGYLSGKTTSEVKAKLDADLLGALKSNYVLWPAAQMINFTVVPPPLRVLYTSGVSVVWNTYLSVVNARTVESDDVADSSLVETKD